METAKLQYTESGQTVCLPSGYSIPGNEAGIVRRGNAIVIFPVDTPWQGLFDSLGKFTSDFMSDREQLPLQARTAGYNALGLFGVIRQPPRKVIKGVLVKCQAHF